MAPKISVLLSVYNGEKYLREATQSILNQSFKDFEFIIIDDGSTDKTVQIIQGFTNSRIVFIKNEKNIGLVKSLNKGLAVARGEYIARMDGDDVSLPNRFEKQVAFLDTHPAVGVVGTAMKQVDAKGRVLSTLTMPADHGLIFWTMFFDLAVIHASVMMRRSVVLGAGGYNEEFIHIEDTELWSRLIFKTQFANLPEPLYIRRLHSKSIISTQSKLQLRRIIEIKDRLFRAVLGKKIPYEVLRWFSSQATTLTNESKLVATSTLQSLYSLFAENNDVSAETKKQIKNDLDQRITAIQNSDTHRFVKNALHLVKKILPAPTRHKLRTSKFGRFFESKFK